jgi:hypothetical protein
MDLGGSNTGFGWCVVDQAGAVAVGTGLAGLRETAQSVAD